MADQGEQVDVAQTELSADQLKVQKRIMLCATVASSAICVVCILFLIYFAVTYNIQKLKGMGWVLYYSSKCPHCQKLKADMMPFKWWAMPKVNCANPDVQCPPQIRVVPTLMNKYTGQLHDGIGIIR